MILIRIMFVLCFIGMIILLSSMGPYDDTDNLTKEQHSGMTLYTDHRTGCQYLGTFMGAVTPRLDKNGRQICD